MRIPVMAATIDRRLLINYRVDPDVIAPMLPAPLRPQLVRGSAVAGICLIRLSRLRPARTPVGTGIRTENAAHRIAVQWTDESSGRPRTGVFIPQRHTDSRPTAWFGGRLFPGVHDHARFDVRESPARQHVAFRADNGSSAVDATVDIIENWPKDGLFDSLAEASAFFRQGCAGYSPSRAPGRLEGLELRTSDWRMDAATATRVTSSFFDDPHLFPPGSARLDTALVMRNIAVTWHELEALPVQPERGRARLTR
jgi:hypothetical protein